jgi:hypothetical protein
MKEKLIEIVRSELDNFKENQDCITTSYASFIKDECHELMFSDGTKEYSVIIDGGDEESGDEPNWIYHQEKKLFYSRITKCASSSIIDALIDKAGFTKGYIINELNSANRETYYNGFTVIRDPKHRWISGLNEFMLRIWLKNRSEHSEQYTYVIKDKINFYVEEQLKQNIFIFDGHTLPQASFLNFIILPNIKIKDFNLIKLDENLNQKISTILQQDIKIDLANIKEYSTYKKNNLNFCREMFEKYCEKNPNYNQLYKNDYELINLSK